MSVHTTGWGADAGSRELRRVNIERRAPRDTDVVVRVDFCGVCYSDLHALQANADADAGLLVPGHEFVGTVLEVGSRVAAFGPGSRVAVGNIVDSCGQCAMCRVGQQNFCHQFPTLTYGGRDRVDGSVTLGAYSRVYVVDANFAYPLPDGLHAPAVAPLMCAGITVWEPMRSLDVGPRTRVAVVGLGGLGHLAVKFAVALGAPTTVISRSQDKSADALALGARAFLRSTDVERMELARESFDVVVDTVGAPHDLAPYLRLVALDGTLAQLGYLGPITVETLDLLVGRKRLMSGGSGGRPSTLEMLQFCARRGITADVEVFPSAQINGALKRLEHNDIRYRGVIDLADLDER